MFVAVCVRTETHVRAQRNPVRSWSSLVTHVFALSKSLCGKESADLQRVLSKTEGFNKSFKTGASAGDQAL